MPARHYAHADLTFPMNFCHRKLLDCEKLVFSTDFQGLVQVSMCDMPGKHWWYNMGSISMLHGLTKGRLGQDLSCFQSFVICQAVSIT
jgi:hypothetical protein